MMPTDRLDLFLAKVVIADNGCVLWTAATDKDGLFGDAARLRERERDDPLSLDV